MTDPLRVLVIDDDDVDRELVTRALRKTTLRAEVTCAEDVDAGLRCLGGGGFDVALVDYRLPGKSGRHLLEVPQVEALPPVILLTGLDDAAVARDCINAGAQDFLIKHELDPRQLERSIRYALERAQLQDALRARVRLVEEQQAALAAKNRELRLFTSAAAHDLSAPVRRVRTFAGMLRSRYAPALGEDGAAWLERMHVAASTIQNLIDGLLVLAEISERERKLEPVDLRALALEVSDGLVDAAGGVVEVGALPVVEGERTELGRLLQNLIGNGLKYRDPERAPRVSVEVRADGEDAVELSVSDNGIGFDEAYAERIFEPFKRLHGDGAFRGTGLGLAICKKVVLQHCGEIRAESRPGVGSVFRVRLPLRQAA